MKFVLGVFANILFAVLAFMLLTAIFPSLKEVSGFGAILGFAVGFLDPAGALKNEEK